MLVSHSAKFIYTKTEKTAGTSVESYFEKFCMPHGDWVFAHARDEYESNTGIIGYRGVNPAGKRWFNHMSAEAIRAQIGEVIWNDYFKFCVIRNPFEKMVSYFCFINEGKRDTMDLIPEFRQWVLKGEGLLLDRDKYLIDGQVCVDFFIRYEDLEKGIERVCGNLDLPFRTEYLPRLKSGARKTHIPASEYYDEKSARVVESVYDFELEYFQYSLQDAQ